MLELFRKYSRHPIIKVLLFAVIITFIGFYGWGSVKERMERYVAEVDENPITKEEFAQAYQNQIMMYQKQFNMDLDKNMIKQLHVKETVLDSLIQQRLLMIQADKMGIIVTNEEVRDKVRSIPAFQKDGRFDQNYYLQALRQVGFTPSQFENDIHLQLLISKIRDAVFDTAKVSSQQLWTMYLRHYQKINLEYIVFKPADFTGKVKKDDGEMKKYYEEHKEDFRLPEEVKIKYIKFTPEHYQDKMQVSEEEIEQYYRSNMDIYREPEEIRARHILIKTGAADSEEEKSKKRKQAEDILKQLKEGADFAKLAKKYSQDGSASKGGDLGYFTRGKMVKPFEEAAFALKIGEVGEVVDTQFGYHIIKLDDRKPARNKELAEVHDEISRKLKLDKASAFVHRVAYAAYRDAIKGGVSLSEIAEREGIDLIDSPAFSRETGFIAGNRDPEFTRRAFSLGIGVVDAPVKVGNNYFLYTKTEHRKSMESTYELAADDVFKAWSEIKAEELAEDAAKNALTDYFANKPMAEIAKAANIELKETGDFALVGSYIPSIGNAPLVKQDLFMLSSEKPRAENYFTVDGNFYLFHLKSRIEVGVEDFNERRALLQRQLLKEERNKLYSLWIDGIREKSDIWINEELLKLWN